jgi:thiol-disulfide isomerase/thioredoxin
MRNLVFALLFMGTVWSSCTEEKPQALKTGMEGKPLPAFAIQLLDSTTFIQSEDLTKGKNLVLFYFSPTCPYCRAQMRDMVNNIERFKDKELCILTNADLKSTKRFADYFKLNQLNNIIVGRDTGNIVLSTYKQIKVPFTAYFDKNNQLKAAYRGRMKPNSLFQF